MSPQANAFQIKGSEIIPGLPRTSDILSGKSLPWGDLHDQDGPREYWVRYNYHRVENWLTGGHQPHDINRREGNVFYFDVPDLQFEGGPLLEGLNLWPGGEWHTAKPFWRQARQERSRHMSRGTLERAEIWVLKTYQCLLLVDQSGAVRILRFAEGTWSLSPVEVDEVVNYLSTRGLAMTTHQGVMWSLKNLELICKTYPEQRFLNTTHGVREYLSRFE